MDGGALARPVANWTSLGAIRPLCRENLFIIISNLKLLKIITVKLVRGAHFCSCSDCACELVLTNKNGKKEKTTNHKVAMFILQKSELFH